MGCYDCGDFIKRVELYYLSPYLSKSDDIYRAGINAGSANLS